jgi:hypothetical protein
MTLKIQGNSGFINNLLLQNSSRYVEIEMTFSLNRAYLIVLNVHLQLKWTHYFRHIYIFAHTDGIVEPEVSWMRYQVMYLKRGLNMNEISDASQSGCNSDKHWAIHIVKQQIISHTSSHLFTVIKAVDRNWLHSLCLLQILCTGGSIETIDV